MHQTNATNKQPDAEQSAVAISDTDLASVTGGETRKRRKSLGKAKRVHPIERAFPQDNPFFL